MIRCAYKTSYRDENNNRIVSYRHGVVTGYTIGIEELDDGKSREYPAAIIEHPDGSTIEICLSNIVYL